MSQQQQPSDVYYGETSNDTPHPNYRSDDMNAAVATVASPCHDIAVSTVAPLSTTTPTIANAADLQWIVGTALEDDNDETGFLTATATTAIATVTDTSREGSFSPSFAPQQQQQQQHCRNSTIDHPLLMRMVQPPSPNGGTTTSIPHQYPPTQQQQQQQQQQYAATWATATATEEATVLLDTQQNYGSDNGKQLSSSSSSSQCASSSSSSVFAVAPRSQENVVLEHSDAQLAATIQQEEEELLLAMKLSAAYESSTGSHNHSSRNSSHRHPLPHRASASSNFTNYRHDNTADTTTAYYGNPQQQQQATVVEISAHLDHDHERTTTTTNSVSPFYRSAMETATTTSSSSSHHQQHQDGMSGDTVLAEWIGSSSVAATAASAEEPSLNHAIYASAATATRTAIATMGDDEDDIHHGNSNGDDYYEVAVIDSAPMEKQDETVGYTEEARIVDIREQQLEDPYQNNNSHTNNTHDDGGDDRKPAATSRPKKRSSSSTHRSNRTLIQQHQQQLLSAIPEQRESGFTEQQQVATTAEVVSIQLESDIHPLLRTNSGNFDNNDSQAQLVGIDHSYGRTAEMVDAVVGAFPQVHYHDTPRSDLLRVPNEPYNVVSTRIDATIICDQEADVIAIQNEDEIHPSDIDVHESTRATMNDAELVGSIDYLNDITSVAHHEVLSENGFHAVALPTTTYLDPHVSLPIVMEQEADVVAIQEDYDVHPLEFDDYASQNTTSAELVGSISQLHIDSMSSNEPRRSSSSTVAMATEAIRSDNIILAEGSISDVFAVDPVIMATAFTDPHQPLLRTDTEESHRGWGLTQDEEVARTLQDAEDVAQTVHDDLTEASTMQDERVARRLQDIATSSQEDGTGTDADFTQSTNEQNSLPTGMVFSETSIPPQPLGDEESNASFQNTPQPSRVELLAREVSRDSTTSDNTNSSQNLSNSISSSIGRGTSIVLEALFGDLSPALGIRRTNILDNEHARHILPRTLLPCSVIHNPASNMWIATLQTNQRALDEKNVTEASKSLRAFSMSSENQARSLARSWTPPRMNRFSDFRFCHICKHRFALLRRACHCRNCGVCVCKDCCVQWPVKMLPDTYNFKKENVVNACRSCDWLSTSFRLALLEGNNDRAVSLFSTGNINLHTPFANVKGELFYPVHCAVLGGNLDLLKFLVDENCCPVRGIRVGGNTKESANKTIPIVTSKGRSLLGIAMEVENLSIVRYLVAEKGLRLSGEKDLTQDLLCRNLEKLLRITPASSCLNVIDGGVTTDPVTVDASLLNPTNIGTNVTGLEPLATPLVDSNNYTNDSQRSALQQQQGTATSADMNMMMIPPPMPERAAPARRRSSHGFGNNQECIICFDHVIDCVATPCGHSVCCLGCSTRITICPVCNGTASFIKIFRA